MSWQLLVLAAGLGSRFGGAKQLSGAGPAGETLLEYSLFDARRAGCAEAVMVIRREHESLIRERFLPRWERHLPCRLAFQDAADLPGKAMPNAARSKPWGTGHAVWSARRAIGQAFAVINADDFYGRAAFSEIGGFFANSLGGISDRDRYALVAYRLRDTLSSQGGVSRGVCRVSDQGDLLSLEEHSGLRLAVDGQVDGLDATGRAVRLSPDTLVSMNFMGMPPSFMERLERGMSAFWGQYGDSLTAEYYLPSALSEGIQAGAYAVRVLPTKGQWMGMTHADDLAEIRQALLQAAEEGFYPNPLV